MIMLMKRRGLSELITEPSGPDGIELSRTDVTERQHATGNLGARGGRWRRCRCPMAINRPAGLDAPIQPLPDQRARHAPVIKVVLVQPCAPLPARPPVEEPRIVVPEGVARAGHEVVGRAAHLTIDVSISNRLPGLGFGLLVLAMTGHVVNAGGRRRGDARPGG